MNLKTGIKNFNGCFSAAVCKKNKDNSIIFACLVFVSIVIIQNAWLCDDIYITLRTVDNFVNGNGLRWNAAERVQVYTHPIWMMLLASMYFFTREAYFTTVAVSIAVSALSIWILFSRISHSFKITILLTSLLISSKAFIDYCTSGLENPATFLFLALAISLLQKTSDEAWFKINLLAALASLNRLDAILFFLPLLVIMFLEYTGGKQRALKESLLAFLPLFGWFVFSLVYYGSLLPNSAYAKLNHGIPLSAILEMGMDYVVDSFMVDPLTLCVISLTIMAAFIWGRKRQKAVAMGVLLYVLYIIWVGGDFMSGRFFAAPFFLSLTLIAGNSFEVMPSFILHKLPMLSGIVLVIALFAVSPPLLTRLDYPSIPATPFVYRTYEGISDEKAYYWPRKGLQRVVVNKLFRSLESQPLNDSEISKVADARIK